MMKDMLITLLKNGNIGKGDIIDALWYFKECDNMSTGSEMPKIISRKQRNDFAMNIPATLSKTGI